MPDQNETTTTIENTFVCACSEWVRSACQGEPFFKEHEGKSYCVLHYPNTDKLEAFRVALKRKLEEQDFDFQGVWFPEIVAFDRGTLCSDANFCHATFSANASFCHMRFSAEAAFCWASFSADVNFDGATFSASADFRSATFSANASFYNATFKASASFEGATLSANANFYHTTFSTIASFRFATFKSYVSFAGSKEEREIGKQLWLDFQFTRIEKPERVSFHTLSLFPHSFINADCRKFEFTDCKWNLDLKEELKRGDEFGVEVPLGVMGMPFHSLKDNFFIPVRESCHPLLAIAYRQMADNAEANHRYHEASRFRYNAFEVRRIEKFWGFVPWRLDWWYWLASGYGESVGKAFLVFVALFALFAFGYGGVGFDQSGKATNADATQATIQPDTVGKPLEWKDAFIYSFYVTILQKPEPKPLTRTAKILVGLETVLGPAQAALLALAVRRRFMR